MFPAQIAVEHPKHRFAIDDFRVIGDRVSAYQVPIVPPEAGACALRQRRIFPEALWPGKRQAGIDDEQQIALLVPHAVAQRDDPFLDHQSDQRPGNADRLSL